MAETLTISRQTPSIKSMDYQFLREEGIRRIQELSGSIWTDYNAHDPGVTILELLCFALTDLGYRTSFDMKDLLAPNPNDNINDGYQFFTARQILHNNALTMMDYRKLLMDVSILADESNPNSEIIGVKNAWISIAEKAEYDVFVDKEINLLLYNPPKIGDQTPLDIKALYNVVLEFSDSQVFGDLNVDYLEENIPAFHPNIVALIRGTQEDPTLEMQPHDQDLYDRIEKMKENSEEDFANVVAQTKELLDLIIKVKVQFPRWDETDLKWEEISEVKKAIQSIELTFIYLPEDLGMVYRLDEDNNILLASSHEDFKSRPVPFIDDITNRLNCLVLGYLDSMLTTYQTKVFKILEILAKAKGTLHANRNICEDFFQFNALKIEEILVCADIELENNANVEEVEGNVYFLLDRFLSPTVNFYSLEEILTKDADEKKYTVDNINKEKNILTVPARVKQALTPGGIISLSGFAAEVLELTVVAVSENPFRSNYTDIEVVESLLTLANSDRGFLFIGKLSEEEERATETVFEGPALENGFIDNEELKIADRQQFINASDVINLIMDVEGVVAVKKLQIANFPQDENPEIESRSVRWCLKLAIDQNYVPRLSTTKSKLTYYKEELPFQANSLASEEIYEELKSAQRPQKTTNPVLDFEVPKGEYRELSDYVSIQDNLPLTYGVGPAGVPLDSLSKEDAILRSSKAKQLKGFLMLFDQLLANYLAQLDHVKDLFSFNPERKDIAASVDSIPSEYDFQVDKTYYSQALYDVVANSEQLYLNFSEANSDDDNKLFHDDILQSITEDEGTFSRRRNKFLDHLMARFAEQFTDYALLAYKLDGSKSDLELIEDKQDLINIYPDISANRGKAFDYKSMLFWYFDNTSGLEKRSTFLTGIDPAEFLNLYFNPEHVPITAEDDTYSFKVLYGTDVLLNSIGSYDSVSAINEVIEKVILYGLCRDSYDITCQKVDGKNKLTISLYMEGDRVVWNENGYDTEEEAEQAIEHAIEVFKEEFFDNPLSNRNNFALPFDPYFTSTIVSEDIDIDEGTYKITFSLYATPFEFTEDKLLLTGTLEGEIESSDIDSEDEIIATAKEKVRASFWQVVYWGKDDCQYIEREYGLAIIDDRLGEDVAVGDPEKINEALIDVFVETEGKTAFEIAVARLVEFFEINFHRQEGLHLLEHILLRPKINNLWVPIETRSDVLDFIPEHDSFVPIEEVLSENVSITVSNNTITIPEGDFTDLLRFNLRLSIQQDEEVYTYQVATYTYDSMENQTVVTTRQDIDSIFADTSGLTVTYEKLLRIVSIEEADFKLVIKEGMDLSSLSADEEEEQNEIQIISAKGDISYGFYRIGSLDTETNEIVLSEFMVQDKLLPIYLPTVDNDIEGDEDCDACKVDNPYSYIAQVVVPAWPGRFDNIDFRSFFERTVRMEAPAHVFLNICWIGYDQMEVFERRLKTWLLENKLDFPAQPYNDEEVTQITMLSKAQNELVDILYELRNVYPVKTLHDCDEGESTEGAIILNQTALGEI